MLRRPSLAILVLTLASCKPPEEQAGMKAIVGAVLIDGSGGPPLSDSVVVIGGDQVRAVGPRSAVPTIAEADRVNGSGKFLLPALVDVCGQVDPATILHPGSPQEARAMVEQNTSRGAHTIHLGQASPAAMESFLESAREARVAVVGHLSSQAEAKLLVDNGASYLIGMIRDTEDLDPALLTRWRDLRVVVAPALSQAGPGLDVAKRNTMRLFRAGVPLGLASLGTDPVAEAEKMAEAGIPPLDIIVAATANGARALGDAGRRGILAPGTAADLLLLSANPGSDIRNLRQAALRMKAGQWIR